MSRGEFEGLVHRLDAYQSAVRRETKSPGRGWTQFAAAAGASLAGAATADAAIQHVVPPAPITVPIPAFYFTYGTQIDLDNDSVDDLQLIARVRSDSFFLGYHYSGLAVGINNHQVIGDGAGYARRFASGESIPAASPASTASLVRRSLTSFGNYFSGRGNWQLDQSGFAGFVKGPPGAKQAGWIRIRTDSSTFTGRLDTITILDWAFQTVSGVPINAGATTEAGVPGDFNNDGRVDAGDYVRWRNNLGDPTEADISNNGDGGDVGVSDYAFWKARYGNPGSGGGNLSSPAPEPGAITLGVLALGAAGITALRRRAA